MKLTRLNKQLNEEFSVNDENWQKEVKDWMDHNTAGLVWGGANELTMKFSDNTGRVNIPEMKLKARTHTDEPVYVITLSSNNRKKKLTRPMSPNQAVSTFIRFAGEFMRRNRLQPLSMEWK